MGLALLVLLGLAAFVIVTYNSLARLRLLAANAWADIDVQLKRRHDLIPTLVATVKGHAGYEKGTLEAVVAGPQPRPERRRARRRRRGGRGAGRIGAADLRPRRGVPRSQGGRRASSRCSANLSSIEDDIQNARRYYNAVVRDLNTKIAQFPSNLVASAFGFRPRESFGLDDRSEQAVPRIDLGAGA